MQYLDADGNVLCEGDIGLYSFHFDSEMKDGIPSGYEGVSDQGIACDKEKREKIHSVTIKIDEIRYPMKSE